MNLDQRDWLHVSSFGRYRTAAMQALITQRRQQHKLALRRAKHVPLEALRQYQRARREHAYRLRQQGLSWRAVGERLGVSATMGKLLFLKGERGAR